MCPLIVTPVMLIHEMAIINEDSLASLAFANGIGPARRNTCVRKMWLENLSLLAACLFDGRLCAKMPKLFHHGRCKDGIIPEGSMYRGPCNRIQEASSIAPMV